VRDEQDDGIEDGRRGRRTANAAGSRVDIAGREKVRAERTTEEYLALVQVAVQVAGKRLTPGPVLNELRLEKPKTRVRFLRRVEVEVVARDGARLL
jgi:hypothetical protein